MAATAGYSGTPLPKKLGIKAGSVVALVGAPQDFTRTLGELPLGARVRSGTRGSADLAVWFVRAASDLRRLPKLSEAAGDIPIWIAWPKKASGVETDLSDRVVRETGLAHGLVDCKVCAIDDTWSGLLFRRRK